MSSSFLSLMQDGQRYMKLWPKQKALNSFLPEGKIIAATNLAIKSMPPLAIFSCALLLQVNGSVYLPQAITVALFFLSMPIQGIMWLGHRSNQVLPPGLLHWYKTAHAKLIAHGCAVEAITTRPKYSELAKLLKTAFNQMDKTFTQDLL